MTQPPSKQQHDAAKDLRVGIDTGGTFTDVAVLRRGRLLVHKLPSTPNDPGEAVLTGLLQAIGKGSRADVVHGSTVGINAVLTGKGLAKTAFVTNEGFLDLIEIGRQDRTDIYDLHASKPIPPVPRRLRFEIASRRHADGSRSRKPTRAEIEKLADKLQASRCESLAIGLLHSPEHPGDELELARALGKALPGIPITCSAELLPRPGEYERFCTAILNAAIVPIMGSYVGRLRDAVPGTLRLLSSSGRILDANDAKRFPARAMFSGPAGGVVATRALAKRLGFERAAALDMGGTSADLSLVEPEPSQAPGEIAGLPLALPTEDVHTIGCGGGSLARLDHGGALRVGPESAGANPGPACYGKGMEPTVTDAHVALGHLGADTLLGGDFPVDPDRSVRAIEKLASSCRLSPRRTAEGILEVARTNMLRALLRITAERGVDPKNVPLVTYGGAGGLHAAALAQKLGMPTAVVPEHPGAFSAIGLALAGEAEEVLQPVLRVLQELSTSEREALAHSAKKQAVDALRSRRPSDKGVLVELRAGLRFAGQGVCLWVAWQRNLEAAFRKAHHQQFGFVPEDRPVELVELSTRAFLKPGTMPLGKRAQVGSRTVARQRKPPVGGPPLPCFQRQELRLGQVLRGPALVEEMTTVTLVPANVRLRTEAAGLMFAF